MRIALIADARGSCSRHALFEGTASPTISRKGYFRMPGGIVHQAWLVVDDTALPKKGSHSVGVAPQYASALGKTANCQTLVSLTLARNEVPVISACACFCPKVGPATPSG